MNERRVGCFESIPVLFQWNWSCSWSGSGEKKTRCRATRTRYQTEMYPVVALYSRYRTVYQWYTVRYCTGIKGSHISLTIIFQAKFNDEH